MDYSTSSSRNRSLGIFLILSLCLILLSPSISLALGYQSIDHELAMLSRPSLILTAGYTGAKWSLHNLAPYNMTSYGRNQAFIDLGIHHPLITLSDAFDFIQIPSIYISTNFGYRDRTSEYIEYIPAMIKEVPYLRSSAWVEFFDYTSFRWREEYYNVNVQNPSAMFHPVGFNNNDFYSDMVSSVDMGCTLRDIEFGLIGSPDGDDHPTMLEVGYFYNYWQRPLAVPDGGFFVDPTLFHPEFRMQGVYLFFNTDLTNGEMPVFIQLGGKLGSGSVRTASHHGHHRFLSGDEMETKMFGLDARISMERKFPQFGEKFLLGLAFQAQIRILDMAYEYDRNTTISLRGSDSRLRLQLFSRYIVF